jgi:hypothetical protein
MANTSQPPAEQYSPLSSERQNDLPPPYTTSDQPPMYEADTESNHDRLPPAHPNSYPSPTTNPSPAIRFPLPSDPSHAYTQPSAPLHVYTLPSAPAHAYITSRGSQDVYATDVERGARRTAVRQTPVRRKGNGFSVGCCWLLIIPLMLVVVGFTILMKVLPDLANKKHVEEIASIWKV